MLAPLLFPDHASYRAFHRLFHHFREVMPQIVAAKLEIGKLADCVLESVLNDRSQREFPDNCLYRLSEGFRLHVSFLACVFMDWFQARPIALEYLDQGVHNFAVAHDHSQFAPFVEFGFAQALAAQKCLTDDRARWFEYETACASNGRDRTHRTVCYSADNSNLDARSRAVSQKPDHCAVAHFGIVDQ